MRQSSQDTATGELDDKCVRPDLPHRPRPHIRDPRRQEEVVEMKEFETPEPPRRPMSPQLQAVIIGVICSVIVNVIWFAFRH